MEATRTPTHGNYSNELCGMILRNTKRIVDALADRLPGTPYDLVEHIEHQLLFQYHRARSIADSERDQFGCQEIAATLINSLLAIRDQLNADERYVRYKTLVGFETVLSPQWDDREFAFTGAHEFRNQRAMEYVNEISDATEDEWYELIVLCAGTESNDLATFPVFSGFLVQLAKTKPATAIRFLRRDGTYLVRFLPAILLGLSGSGDQEGYWALVRGYLSEGRHLWAIARHFQNAATALPADVKELLDKAIAASDDLAVNQCLILSVKLHDSQNRPLLESVFVPAIRYLIARKDVRWLGEAWWMTGAKTFFASLTDEYANLTLEDLSSLPVIDHGADAILAYIAEAHPDLVWEFFGWRLEKEGGVDGERYEAFPYSFHDLQEPLARDAESAIAVVRSWFHGDDPLFRFRGGRLLSTVFSGFSAEFSAWLREMAQNGSNEDLNFILAVMQNYHGEAVTHPLLQDIVNRVSEDDPGLAKVEISLKSTDGVVGEFGMVDAFRKKKEQVALWLEDPRARIKTFATEYIKSLDRSMAAEQRTAEQEHELRRRDFEAGGEP